MYRSGELPGQKNIFLNEGDVKMMSILVTNRLSGERHTDMLRGMVFATPENNQLKQIGVAVLPSLFSGKFDVR